jgi:hypothetical protein
MNPNTTKYFSNVMLAGINQTAFVRTVHSM